jgi:hypothetical protein
MARLGLWVNTLANRMTRIDSFGAFGFSFGKINQFLYSLTFPVLNEVFVAALLLRPARNSWQTAYLRNPSLIWEAVLLAPEAADVDAVVGVNLVEVPVGMETGAKNVILAELEAQDTCYCDEVE